MSDDQGEKTIDPTPHRRQQARERGEVARSHDLSSAGLLVGGLLVLIFTGRSLVDFLTGMFTGYLSGESWMGFIHSDAASGSDLVMRQWNPLVEGLAKVLLPVLGMAMLLAVGLTVLQTGLLFQPRRLLPDASRINPLSGLGRLFSTASGVRLTFGIFKIGMIAAVAFFSLYQRRGALLDVASLELPQIATFAWDVCLWTCIKIGVALVALAALDYGYQRWKHERDLKMTPQEMREEMRNLQGDPRMVARRRNAQRQIGQNRLSALVPTADVVITGRADQAVALRYAADTMDAPLVVAKGVGPIAARIRTLAADHGIPIVEKDALTAAVYQEVALNRPISGPLYAGVAEVLAHARALRDKRAADQPAAEAGAV